jgi:hypothetical protein
LQATPSTRKPSPLSWWKRSSMAASRSARGTVWGRPIQRIAHLQYLGQDALGDQHMAAGFSHQHRQALAQEVSAA